MAKKARTMTVLPEDLNHRETLAFRYLQAVYSLNTFYGYHLKPSGYFETTNEKACAAVIEQGGTIVDMYRAGADPLYCALLPDPLTDKGLFLKTIDLYIPF
jgi:hypothetical protein